MLTASVLDTIRCSNTERAACWSCGSGGNTRCVGCGLLGGRPWPGRRSARRDFPRRWALMAWVKTIFRLSHGDVGDEADVVRRIGSQHRKVRATRPRSTMVRVSSRRPRFDRMLYAPRVHVRAISGTTHARTRTLLGLGPHTVRAPTDPYKGETRDFETRSYVDQMSTKCRRSINYRSTTSPRGAGSDAETTACVE